MVSSAQPGDARAFGQAIGAGGVVGARSSPRARRCRASASAMRSSSVATHTSRAPAASARRATCSDQRLAAEQAQRLARQARGGVARGDGDDEIGCSCGIVSCGSHVVARRACGRSNATQNASGSSRRAPARCKCHSSAKARALHRVLLGHQHRQLAAELEIGGDVGDGGRRRHAAPRAMPSAAQHPKKRSGLPMPATACTRWPANDASGAARPPSQRHAPRRHAGASAIRRTASARRHCRR